MDNNVIINELTSNTEAMLAVEKQILQATVNFRKQLEEYQNKDKELREALLKSMEDNGVKSFENDLLKVTYVAPTKRVSVDAKRLESDLPELFEEYKKVSDVKANVRITVKTVTKRVA